MRSLCPLALLTLSLALGCQGGGAVVADSGTAEDPAGAADSEPSGDSANPRARGCDPLVPTYCGFPFPNDYWTVADPTTATGIRLALPEAVMPVSRTGVRASPTPFNAMDGFSSGVAAMAHLPGATAEGLPTPETIADSLDPSSPTVMLEGATGKRLAHWVDLDAYVVEAKQRADAGKERPSFTISRPLSALQQERALMLRPAVRPEDATRYIVALRGVRNEAGALLDPPPAFRTLRDGSPTDDPTVEARRAHFETIFVALERAGIARAELQLAWDYTTASRANNTQAMVHMRDDALGRFPDGVPYDVEVNNERLHERMACRLEIDFEMPLYLDKGEAGGLLNLGDDGLPRQNGTFSYAAALVVPASARTEPAGLVQFGHGQLGKKEQIVGFQPIAAELNLAAFALDWKGFALDDVPNVIRTFATGDASRFRTIPERMHQGFLNLLLAMRTLSRAAEGGASTRLNQMLASACNGARIDGSKRYFFGGSQGGILGASIMALTTDIARGVVAVPGQPYNLLLQRSVNFDVYASLLYMSYDWNALAAQMTLALMQGLWDRAEPTGYSKYIRTGRLPGTPAHEVLIQVSRADHQVTTLGAHIMARTIGGVVNLAPLIRPLWGIPSAVGPHAGSAMIEIDFGNPKPPITNTPPWDDTMKDPHGRAEEVRALGAMLGRFYEEGVAENVCDGPCDADDIQGTADQ